MGRVLYIVFGTLSLRVKRAWGGVEVPVERDRYVPWYTTAVTLAIQRVAHELLPFL